MKSFITFVLLLMSLILGFGAVGKLGVSSMNGSATNISLYGTIQGNLITTINVRAYPYLAGIGGDDTPKIQAALDAAANTSGTSQGRQRVYMPMGAYNVSGTLLVHPRMILEGENTQQGIVSYLSFGSAGGIILEAPGGQTIRNLSTDGTKSSTYALRTSTDISLACNYIKIENFEANNVLHGIYISNAWNVDILSPYLASCGNGITIDGNANAIHILGGEITSNTNGIYLNARSGGSINQIDIVTTIEGNVRGIYGTNAANNMRNLNIDKCYFEQNTFPVWIDGRNGTFQSPAITFCFFGAGLQTNIWLNGCERPLMIGNYHFNNCALYSSPSVIDPLKFNNYKESGVTELDTSTYTDNGTGLINIIYVYEFNISDETTPITTGTAKVTWRAPFAMTLINVRASLTAASISGIPTVNIKEAGTTIFSTKLTIDANELTSTTAADPYVFSDTAIANDAQITFDIDVAGTSAAGLKIRLYYMR